MQEFDFVTNARVVAERKGITEDQAMNELMNIKESSKSDWGFGLAVRNYLEGSQEVKTGSPHGVEEIDPVHHTKE